MVVYHLNYSLVRFILGASRDEFVNVALMFVILYPERESNPHALWHWHLKSAWLPLHHPDKFSPMRLVWGKYSQFFYSKPNASYRLKVNYYLEVS